MKDLINKEVIVELDVIVRDQTLFQKGILKEVTEEYVKLECSGKSCYFFKKNVIKIRGLE